VTGFGFLPGLAHLQSSAQPAVRRNGLQRVNKESIVQPGIHPKYEITSVSCSCGSVFQTRSTKQNLRSELCNECHPFFTGRQKLVDTGGRVDRFNRRFGKRSGGQA
jgi:large subunit ribosomal protein L31